MHLSLLDDQGRNCFDDGSAHGAAPLRHAIGGLLHTLPEAMALYCEAMRLEARKFADHISARESEWYL